MAKVSYAKEYNIDIDNVATFDSPAPLTIRGKQTIVLYDKEENGMTTVPPFAVFTKPVTKIRFQVDGKGDILETFVPNKQVLQTILDHNVGDEIAIVVNERGRLESAV